LPIYYLRQVAQTISDMGVDVHAWLARSGLQESQLDDTNQTLTFATFRTLVLDALSMTQEPALGLLVGSHLRLNTHGVLGYAAMNCSTLQQTIEVLERYSLLRTPLVKLQHQMINGQLHVMVVENFPLGDIRQVMLEAALLGVKNVVDFLAAGARPISPVTQVVFACARPAYAPLAVKIFQCEVVYDQPWTGFVLPAETASRPLHPIDPNTYQEALTICQRALDKIIQDETLAMRVRRILLERSTAFPSLQLTARLFHMTPRTLHRNLLLEGSSYRSILEEVRHTLAIEHLKTDRLNIQEIAFTLGYSDMANFRRAFKRWQGLAPSDFRQQALNLSSSAAPRAPGTEQDNEARYENHGPDDLVQVRLDPGEVAKEVAHGDDAPHP
jgi:AraC-like DNA-binding protein